ncbi:MAG TPA: DUF480 domain-containing protein, partial [Xanthomonadaceae bacterium]|nr:DUF480 domain-containing protein [Xanthomonadaceae bacterium]
TLACNQKNNRDPLMQLTPGEVGHALRSMEVRKLVRSVHGARAQRWEHRFAEALSVTAKQQALLGVLILRGPQTAPELFTRTGRLAGFDDLEDLRYSLDRMIQQDPPYAVNLGRAAGQREERYMHLLCGPVAAEAHARAAASAQASPAGGRAALETRIEDLEAQVQSLREELDALRGRTD